MSRRGQGCRSDLRLRYWDVEPGGGAGWKEAEAGSVTDRPSVRRPRDVRVARGARRPDVWRLEVTGARCHAEGQQVTDRGLIPGD